MGQVDGIQHDYGGRFAPLQDAVNVGGRYGRGAVEVDRVRLVVGWNAERAIVAGVKVRVHLLCGRVNGDFAGGVGEAHGGRSVCVQLRQDQGARVVIGLDVEYVWLVAMGGFQLASVLSVPVSGRGGGGQ